MRCSLTPRCSGSTVQVTTDIHPFPAGEQPLCRRVEDIHAGNVDCAALLWLEEYLAGADANTTVVVISDGQPASYYCGVDEHTTQLAQGMVDKGVKLAAIQVRYKDIIYPAEITAFIDRVEDMDKIWPVLQAVSSAGE